LTGAAYAIPTKGLRLEVLDLVTIAGCVETFIDYATQHPAREFYLTRIGCGLAGYSDAQIAPLFKRCPRNVNVPVRWLRYL
jgi:hypothetical protein